MDYRYLGRTGVNVSPLCLGCMMFGWRTEPGDAYAIIDRALDAGINFFDTADVYAGGGSETVVGEALKRNGKRENVVVATKVCGVMGEDVNNARTSRRHIIEGCEKSLQRLQTDYIDLYQLHRPLSQIAIDETLRALDDLVRSGKVRYIGTSTFAAWQVVESLWVAKEYGLNRFVCEQPPYNILDRRIERELLPMCQTFGIGAIPWGPLASGLLTGKYRQGQPKPADGRFVVNDNPPNQRRYSDAALEAIEKLLPYARQRGMSLSQFSLAWLLQRPGVTSPIIGPRTMAQLEDNLGALDFTITDADREFVDSVVAPGDYVSSFYEADFGPHPHRV